MRNDNLLPWGGNYVLCDIYLIEQRGEDTGIAFHLPERGHTMALCEYNLTVSG